MTDFPTLSGSIETGDVIFRAGAVYEGAVAAGAVTAAVTVPAAPVMALGSRRATSPLDTPTAADSGAMIHVSAATSVQLSPMPEGTMFSYLPLSDSAVVTVLQTGIAGEIAAETTFASAGYLKILTVVYTQKGVAVFGGASA